MTTPTDGSQGHPDRRIDRIRRRLIWALLGPFCILMSVAAIEGSRVLISCCTCAGVMCSACASKGTSFAASLCMPPKPFR